MLQTLIASEPHIQLGHSSPGLRPYLPKRSKLSTQIRTSGEGWGISPVSCVLLVFLCSISRVWKKELYCAFLKDKSSPPTIYLGYKYQNACFSLEGLNIVHPPRKLWKMAQITGPMKPWVCTWDSSQGFHNPGSKTSLPTSGDPGSSEADFQQRMTNKYKTWTKPKLTYMNMMILTLQTRLEAPFCSKYNCWQKWIQSFWALPRSNESHSEDGPIKPILVELWKEDDQLMFGKRTCLGHFGGLHSLKLL